MATGYSEYGNENFRSPMGRMDFRDGGYEASPTQYLQSQGSDYQEDPVSFLTKIKSFYSINEQVQGLEKDSSWFYKLLLRGNYLLRNGLYFNSEDINKVLQKKNAIRKAHRGQLKFAVYQEVSDYLAFVNHNNKIYLIKTEGQDSFQTFNVNGVIQAMSFHPYKKLWMAIATTDQVKILNPEVDDYDETFLSSINPYDQPRREDFKLQKFLHLDISCTAIEFSPDGRYLAMINEHSTTIHLWDFDSKCLKSHKELGFTCNKMKWSPDGAYLALSSEKTKKLCIMEASTWQNQKWSLKASISVKIQMAWSCDANTLYIFMKETLEIRAVRDVQVEKSKTAFERREIEFRIAEVYRLKLEDYHQLQSFAFCIEPHIIRYAYIADIQGKEFTKLGTIEEMNEEKVCEIAENRPPVRAFFFMSKLGRPYEQKQPVVYKCYSKEEIENIKL